MNWWQIVRRGSPTLYFDLDEKGVRSAKAKAVAWSALKVGHMPQHTHVERLADPPRKRLKPTGQKALEYTIYMEAGL